MKYIYIGKIVNTHGIKGEIRLISTFKYKDKVFVPNMNIYIGKEKIKEVITSYRPHKQFDMICMKDYNNINQILKYKGEKVYINKEDLKLNEHEYLDEDLIGMNVIMNNKVVGIIKNIEYNSKQSLIVVKVGEKDCLIPYVSDIIENIDFKKGCISLKNIKGLI